MLFLINMWKYLQARTEPAVFVSASLIMFFLVGIVLIFPNHFDSWANMLNGFLVNQLGWFYILSISTFLFFSLWLMLGRFHHIRLGDDNERPKYSFYSWIAMLFSAGMGIGLMFFGIAEPLIHFLSPPSGEGSTLIAARQAMNISYFHWGIHAWASYIIIGLSIAYFGFRKKLPLSIRSTLYPILGHKIYSWPGHIVDVVAVLGTLFGVATSLGIGVMQINSGLNSVFSISISPLNQAFLIVAITLFATISVVSGLDKGIKILSSLNMILAFIFLIFVFAFGPTLFILNSFVQNTGYFLQNIIQTTTWTDAYRHTGWLGNWTIFYWAWWISWAPFVGIFIARISRGRTLREFVIGTMFVPAALTFLWFSVFGGAAISMQLSKSHDFSSIVNTEVSLVLFEFLQQLPFSTISSILAIIVVLLFFITSSDSGSFVIDMIASGGKANPNPAIKIYWASLEGVIAIILLLGGGLKALQTATITSAFPFSIIMLLICWGLFKSLKEEENNIYQNHIISHVDDDVNNL